MNVSSKEKSKVYVIDIRKEDTNETYPSEKPRNEKRDSRLSRKPLSFILH